MAKKDTNVFDPEAGTPATSATTTSEPSLRFTATQKDCAVVKTDDPRYAQNLQQLGYSVIDGLSGKEYTGKRPA